MWLCIRSILLGLLLTGAAAGGQEPAGNEGQDDLDRATEVKLTATTLSDLGEVIRLCDSALEQGLDEDNARFAKQLLASTRIQRGLMIAKMIFERIRNRSLDRMWPEYRRVALEDLEKGVELDPQQPHALYQIAQLNVLPGGDTKRAAGALDQAIGLSQNEPPLQAKALLLRAGLQKEPEKRLADLEEAIRVNPGDAAGYRARGAFHADQQKYELALADLEKAIQIEPNHAATHEARGKVLIDLKRYDDAMDSLDKARELAPKAVGPLVEKARIYGIQSKYEAALEVLQQAYLLDPVNPVVLLLRASVYQELGKEDKALNDIDQVLTLRPGFPLAMRFRAVLLARSGKIDLAAAELERLLKTEPEDVQIELQLALFYNAEGEPNKAIEKLSAVLEKQPERVEALLARADTLLGIGKQAEAIADYERALKLQADDSHLLNNLAWVLATSPDEKLRDGKRAIELATKACELTDYKQAHILSTLGAGYAETGDFETAIQWSKKAVELGGKNEEEQKQLVKELETYLAKKPVRELLTGPEPKQPKPDKPETPEKPRPKSKEKPEEAEKPAPKSKEKPEESPKLAPKSKEDPEVSEKPAAESKEKPEESE